MTNYKTLEIWKKSLLLVKDVYTITRAFPKDELYVLTSQLRRAAISIPANVAEGYGRNHKKDSIQFFHVSRGSLYELETLLNIAFLTGALKESHFNQLSEALDECLKIINGLINYFERTSIKQ